MNGQPMDRDQRRHWRRYVIGCADLTPAQRIVLLALETFADFPSGTNARPGGAVLAEMCELSRRAVELALGRGRELNLICQTVRANPKAHRAAVYRLVPVPVSMRTTVRLEPDFNPNDGSPRNDFKANDGSPRNDFKANGDDFKANGHVISKRTAVRPTNKDSPIHNTNRELTRASARAREIAPAPNPHPLDNQAAELVKQTLPPTLPHSVRAGIRVKVRDLLNDGTDPDVVTEALHKWNDRTDAGPGLLAHLAGDVIKERNGATPTGRKNKLRAWAELATQMRAEEEAEAAQAAATTVKPLELLPAKPAEPPAAPPLDVQTVELPAGPASPPAVVEATKNAPNGASPDKTGQPVVEDELHAELERRKQRLSGIKDCKLCDNFGDVLGEDGKPVVDDNDDGEPLRCWHGKEPAA